MWNVEFGPFKDGFCPFENAKVGLKEGILKKIRMVQNELHSRFWSDDVMLVSYNVMKKFLDFQSIFVILNITILTQKIKIIKISFWFMNGLKILKFMLSEQCF